MAKGRGFDSRKHPRDRLGRFSETNVRVEVGTRGVSATASREATLGPVAVEVGAFVRVGKRPAGPSAAKARARARPSAQKKAPKATSARARKAPTAAKGRKVRP